MRGCVTACRLNDGIYRFLPHSPELINIKSKIRDKTWLRSILFNARTFDWRVLQPHTTFIEDEINYIRNQTHLSN